MNPANSLKVRPLLVERIHALISDLAREAWDEALAFTPSGRRVLVVRERPVEKIGSIHVPDSRQVALGVGFVVSVAEGVGTASPAEFPGGWIGQGEDLVGQRIAFGIYAGTSGTLSLFTPSGRAVTDYIVMTDRDVWGVLPYPKEGA